MPRAFASGSAVLSGAHRFRRDDGAKFRGVAVPKLTSEQRAEALAQAAQSRAARAEVRARVKQRSLTIADVVDMAEHNPVIAKMRVSALLEALPSIGKTRSQAIMDRLGISPTRRLQGLGAVQRRALLSEFRD